ncbi:MAG: FG-GAP repeat domain-containing protein [Promethearchaeota archaeon]|jgi:hypothetical protein
MKKILWVALIISIIGSAAIILTFSLTLRVPSSKEINFNKIVLTTNFQEAGRIFGVDVDNDGDVDVIGAAEGDDEIAWWENNNLTFTKHVITSNFDGVFFINIGDVDKDGDIDVLGPGSFSNEIAWWENNGTSFVRHNISTNYQYPYSINSFDVNGDGDIDILTTGTASVDWWENDGNENFTQHQISIGYPEISSEGHASIFAADLDMDNDTDICTGSTSSAFTGEICAWVNDGTENFTKIELTTNYARVHDLKPIDMDNDGDLDICANSATLNTVDWFENIGNLTFIKHIVGSNYRGPDTLFPIDLDDDGDIDIIGTAYLADKISWFENVGSCEFTEHIISSGFNGAATCHAIDVDNDSDIDVIGGAYDADEIAIWLQN